MRRRLVKIGLGALGALLSLSALCGPMGFKDSWMSMGDVSPNWQEVFVNYAFTARDAAGASALVMRSDDGIKSRQLTEATYTRLAKRWNMPEAQANCRGLLPARPMAEALSLSFFPSMWSTTSSALGHQNSTLDEVRLVLTGQEQSSPKIAVVEVKSRLLTDPPLITGEQISGRIFRDDGTTIQ